MKENTVALVSIIVGCLLIIIHTPEYLQTLEKEKHYNIEFETCSDFSSAYVTYDAESNKHYWNWFNVCNVKVTEILNQ